MSLTSEQIQAINLAVHEALNTLNTPTEVVYPTPENVQIVRRFLLAEGVPQNNWSSAFIWQSAFTECRSRGLLVERPPKKTREELERERRAADAAPGRQTKIKDGDGHEKPKGNLDDFLGQVKTKVNEMFNPQPEAPVQKTQWPTLMPYEQMDAQNKRLYRALPASEMRAFLSKLQVSEHRKKYELDPVEE